MRRIHTTALVAAAVVALTGSAQANAATKPQLTAIGHAVKDLNKTVAFYHGVLGLQVVSEMARPRTDPQLARVDGLRHARYRSARIAIPNEPFTLELTQYYGVQQHPVQGNHQDPGTPALTLSIKDPVKTFAALRAAHTPTLVRGGTIPDGTGIPTVFVRDPDGFIVETVHRSGTDWFTVPAPTVTDGPGMSQVIRGQFDYTMKTGQQALDFYRGVLGFDISSGFPAIGVMPGQYATVGGLGNVLGIDPDARFTAVTGNCAPTVRCEFFEYDDPARRTLSPPVQDPGAPVITIDAGGDVAAFARRATAAGARVVTPGGRPVKGRGGATVLLRDPSGLLLRVGHRQS